MLREDRNDHGGIFGPLALVDGRGVGGNEDVELAESVGHDAPVEGHRDFADLRVDVGHIADAAVVDLLVIVLDLRRGATSPVPRNFGRRSASTSIACPKRPSSGSPAKIFCAGATPVEHSSSS